MQTVLANNVELIGFVDQDISFMELISKIITEPEYSISLMRCAKCMKKNLPNGWELKSNKINRIKLISKNNIDYIAIISDFNNLSVHILAVIKNDKITFISDINTLQDNINELLLL